MNDSLNCLDQYQEEYDDGDDDDGVNDDGGGDDDDEDGDDGGDNNDYLMGLKGFSGATVQNQPSAWSSPNHLILIIIKWWQW